MSKEDKLQKLLSEYLSEEETLLPWSQLSAYTLYEWFEFGEGITGSMVYLDEDSAVFLTKMKKGSGFGPHSHDMQETVLVVKGFIHELTTKEKAADGGVIRYGEFIRHEPVSPIEDTLLVVVFKRKPE